MIYLSGPAIARLVTCSRIAAHQRMSRGDYGPLLRRGGILFAALAAVEAHIGHKFSPEQIEAAIDGYPDRMIVHHQQEAANGEAEHEGQDQCHAG